MYFAKFWGFRAPGKHLGWKMVGILIRQTFVLVTSVANLMTKIELERFSF
jgi:hypothetical protein